MHPDSCKTRASALAPRCALAAIASALVCLGIALAATPRLPTTITNFFHPGTQAGEVAALPSPFQCISCHGSYNANTAPFDRWVGSAMAQSARDPVFKAALAIAEQDAAFVGYACLRCHAPPAWAAGHVQFDQAEGSPTFGKSLPLAQQDRFGISCAMCHRMVDPEYTPGDSPSEDEDVLNGLVAGAPEPANLHNAAFVLDPIDRRRGPYNLDADWMSAGLGPFPGFHEWLHSPFHTESRQCASCHDVSTAHFTRQKDGSFALNAADSQPASSKHEQFPEQRTFSEWEHSLFQKGPVDLAGRFGGTRGPLVSSCQDCHMPGVSGRGCLLNPPTRSDLGQHDFAGVNSWMVRSVRALFPDSETGLSENAVNGAISRNASMLARASDLELSAERARLNVRIINFGGHKLPTGYPEGRRMWINVRFFDGDGALIAERGRYDAATATLTETDTKVYEAVLGLDASIAQFTGQPEGPAFRLALANKIFKDNRIPPMGFTNAAFEGAGAGHVPAGQYADGQYWDDVPFTAPAQARSAEVRVYHQTSSREYMEFLRDANTTDSAGQVAYDQWVAHGRSAPVLMDEASVPLPCACDWNGTGAATVQDVFEFLRAWFAGDIAADFSGNGKIDRPDVYEFLGCWFAGCG